MKKQKITKTIGTLAFALCLVLAAGLVLPFAANAEGPEPPVPETTEPEATEPSVPETTKPEATEPSVSETTEPKAEDSNVPDTGDESNLTVLTAVTVIALTGAAVLVVSLKKNRI